MVNPVVSFVLFAVAEYLFPGVNWYMGFPSLLFSLPFKLPYNLQLSISQVVTVIFLITVLPLPSALIFRMLIWELSNNHVEYGEALRVLRTTVNWRSWFRSIKVFLAVSLGGVSTLIIGLPFVLLFLYGYRLLYILPGIVTAGEFYNIFFVCLLGSVMLSAISYRLLRTKFS